VRCLRSHTLMHAEMPIYGMIRDVRSGRLLEVAEDVAIGAPMQPAWSRAASGAVPRRERGATS
jgi:hypothetical protein